VAVTGGERVRRFGDVEHVDGELPDVTDVRAARPVRSSRRDRALLENMSDILMVVGPEGVVRHVGPSATRFLGRTTGAVVGSDLLELVHPQDRDGVRAALADVTARPEEPVLLEMRLRAADGTFRHCEALADNLIDDAAVAGVLVVVREVTGRNRSGDAEPAHAGVLELIASEAPILTVLQALAMSVEEQIDDTLCTVLLAESSKEGLIFRHGASPSMPTGYRTALEGRPVSGDPSPCGMAVRSRQPVVVEDLMTDDRFEVMRGLAAACDVRGCWTFPVLSPTSGVLLGTFALYPRSPGLPDERTAAIVSRASWLVAIALDRHALVEKLAHQAQNDELTGLPNRLMLLNRLTHQLGLPDSGGAAGPGVLFIDLDRLKIVNDSLGHDVGDELLVRIADRLRAAVPEDAMVARFAGDEFVVLVDRLEGPEEGCLLAERILSVIATPVQLAGRTITPTASAGLVVGSSRQTAIDVLRDADVAMYRAKHGSGPGYALFTEDMRRRAFDRLDLEGQIRHGLANDEFRVFYQPVVDLTDADALVGFEALVRWQHPKRGLLSPVSFVGLAEETGLIVELGEWVLRTVARTVGAWSVAVPDLCGAVAVNLAARQLLATDLVPSVRSAMLEMGGWALGLELTESTLMSDTSATRAVIDELVALGASLAIDDFGTGFSSLSYLTRLPVRTLKIDRTFVQDLGNPGAAAVAATVISLATSLGLAVVAEGIETREQRAALLEMGCRFGQGYLLGRPLPESDALDVLRAAAGALRAGAGSRR
jgi:diguanylate cyclase (GGDEF)-like protein/PAS domain S-box-containing protein